MTSRRPNARDLRASLFAAVATLVTVLLNGPGQQMERPVAERGIDGAVAGVDGLDGMSGLIGADQAQTEGAWLLDQPAARARLSFAPQYDRLVWRVGSESSEVLLDAATGEALEFQFD